MIHAEVEEEKKEEVEGNGKDYESFIIQSTIDFISTKMILEINLIVMRRMLVSSRSLS